MDFFFGRTFFFYLEYGSFFKHTFDTQETTIKLFFRVLRFFSLSRYTGCASLFAFAVHVFVQCLYRTITNTHLDMMRYIRYSERESDHCKDGEACMICIRAQIPIPIHEPTKKTIKLLSNVCKFVPPNWIVAHAFCLNIRNTLMRGAWLAYVLDAFVLNASNHTFSPHSHAQQRIYSFFAISQKKGEYFGISRCWTATKKQHLFLYCCRTIFRLQFDFEMIAFFGMQAVLYVEKRVQCLDHNQ